MLKWHDDLYTSPGVHNVDGIREKLEDGRPLPGVYLLTLPSNPANVMDILPAITLVQRTAAGLCPEIIGIAQGRAEALELVRWLIHTMYKETGGFDLAFFCKKH